MYISYDTYNWAHTIYKYKYMLPSSACIVQCPASLLVPCPVLLTELWEQCPVHGGVFQGAHGANVPALQQGCAGDRDQKVNRQTDKQRIYQDLKEEIFKIKIIRVPALSLDMCVCVFCSCGSSSSGDYHTYTIWGG